MPAGWDLIRSKRGTLLANIQETSAQYVTDAEKSCRVTKGMMLQEEPEPAVLDMSGRLAKWEI